MADDEKRPAAARASAESTLAASAAHAQRYLLDFTPTSFRFAITIELLRDAVVTWYQSFSDFSAAECAGIGWERAAAARFARCAAALEAGHVTAADLPPFTGGRLSIVVRDATACVTLADARRGAPARIARGDLVEVPYRNTWWVPVDRLAAVFRRVASFLQELYGEEGATAPPATAVAAAEPAAELVAPSAAELVPASAPASAPARQSKIEVAAPAQFGADPWQTANRAPPERLTPERLT